MNVIAAPIIPEMLPAWKQRTANGARGHVEICANAPGTKERKATVPTTGAINFFIKFIIYICRNCCQGGNIEVNAFGTRECGVKK